MTFALMGMLTICWVVGGPTRFTASERNHLLYQLSFTSQNCSPAGPASGPDSQVGEPGETPFRSQSSQKGELQPAGSLFDVAIL